MAVVQSSPPAIPAPRASTSDPAARWLTGCLLFAALWWVLDLAVLRAGTPHPLDDVWEDGIVARLLLEGAAWRTLMIYPPLWPLRDPATSTVPVLVHGPLLPALVALPLRLLGPGVLDQLAWAAALCAVLTAVPLFRIATRAFGPAVAAAAVGLFTLSPITLVAVHHSLSVILGALLFTVAFELATRERPRGATAGLALGLGYLVRPEMLVVALILALLVGRAAGARAAVRLIGGFVACALPWWVHHAAITGSPFFNLTAYTLVGYWGERPGTAVLRDFDLTLRRWPGVLLAELPGLWRKWLYMFPRALRYAAFAPSPATGWLMLLGAGAALAQPASRRAASAAVLLAALPVVAMTLTYPQRLYIAPFLPLYAIAAAAGARSLSGLLPAWGRRPRVWIALLLLLTLPGAVPELRVAAIEAALARDLFVAERRALASTARGAGSPTSPMFSDRPDFVAWTTWRPTLWMTRDEYERYYPITGPTEATRPHGLPSRRDPADTWFHDGHWARGRTAWPGTPPPD